MRGTDVPHDAPPGLTLLLPYILSTRRAWSSSPLRIFTLANKNTELEIEERK
ncbi:hypothetical protein F3H09_34060 [Pseudomonas aeruginosa]|nr:hypothetical protein F3H09_34060 [Pseudomonas aeruginosa]